MNKIIVRSRLATERKSPYPVPWAVISITDADAPDARIRTANCVGLLRLKFDDIRTPSPYFVAFTSQDARRILAFAADVWDKADVLLVHCEAGISRSAGVAAALSRIYFGENAKFFAASVPPQQASFYYTILEANCRSEDARPKQPREEEENNS